MESEQNICPVLERRQIACERQWTETVRNKTSQDEKQDG